MDLAPTWETLAETMTEAAVELVDEEFEHLREGHDYSEEEYKDALKVKLPVMVAKIDCVEHKAFCFQNSIWAYPTLRLYIRGAPVADYQGDRTLLEMVHWLAHVEEEHQRQIGDENFNVLLADERKSVLVPCSIHNVVSYQKIWPLCYFVTYYSTHFHII